MSEMQKDIDLAKEVLDLVVRAEVRGIGYSLLAKLVEIAENRLNKATAEGDK